jgi:glycosyltransferase involved in cell wall biosynthesis
VPFRSGSALERTLWSHALPRLERATAPQRSFEEGERMTPKRIVYVWDADYPWDVRTEKTCLSLTQAGHDVHIVARNRKWSPTTERLAEGTVHRMPPWRWAGQRLDGGLGFPLFCSPRWRSLISHVVHEVNADLIIARDLPLCPTAIRAGRAANVPVMLDMAENYPAMMRAIWESDRDRPLDYLVRNPALVTRVEDYCIHRVAHTIVVVEESADRLLAKGVPQERVSVVSNTPPAARADSVTPTPSRPPGVALDIVYIGIIEVARGLLESIDAIARLRDLGHRARLRLIGSGRDDALMRARAASLGLGGDTVEFLGYVQHDEALKIVAAADVGLLPHRKCESWDTTIPNKLFDYMAAGLPVVSSNAEPCARILAKTGAGEVFRSNDPADLAAALTRLLDPTRRTLLGAAGRHAIHTQYNWEKDSSVLLALVDTIA